MTASDNLPDELRKPPAHSVEAPLGASGEANLLTLAALGIVAFVAETTLHEAAGHGSVCLATGGRITLLAPLYMRCSVVSLAMVAAGPAMNLLCGAVAWLALQSRPAHVGAGRYFLWLILVFNWLVAAGYVLVGAATGFGDWSVLFQRIEPSWHWRVPLGVSALLLYCGFRWVAARELVRLTGIARPDAATLGRLVLVPTGAAAVVALGAQAYGQGSDPLGLALACGSTIVVGFTLLGIEGRHGDGSSTIEESKLRIGRSSAWLIVAALVAVVFVLCIGPGADLSAVGR